MAGTHKQLAYFVLELLANPSKEGGAVVVEEAWLSGIQVGNKYTLPILLKRRLRVIKYYCLRYFNKRNVWMFHVMGWKDLPPPLSGRTPVW